MEIEVTFLTYNGTIKQKMELNEYIKILKIVNWFKKNKWFKGTNTTELRVEKGE